MPDFRLLADIPEQMDEQEPTVLPGRDRQGTDIQPDGFSDFAASLDVEIANATTAAEPLSDGARRRAERMTGEGHAAHHLVTGTSDHLTSPEPQQALCCLVPQHDTVLFINQHGGVSGPLQHRRD